MCGICLAGLLAGRFAGVPGPVMLAVALGVLAILWMVWVDPPSSSRRTSALAHAAGGALAGWALATTLLVRGRPHWLAGALAGVITLAVVWELGEFVGDTIFDTALVPKASDSAEDLLFGCLGGVAGIAAARVLLALRPRTMV
jgi:hypothetical protein